MKSVRVYESSWEALVLGLTTVEAIFSGLFVLLAGGKRKAWLSVSSLARQLLAFYFILCRTSVTREADALTLGYWKKSR